MFDRSRQGNVTTGDKDMDLQGLDDMPMIHCFTYTYRVHISKWDGQMGSMEMDNVELRDTCNINVAILRTYSLTLSNVMHRHVRFLVYLTSWQ